MENKKIRIGAVGIGRRLTHVLKMMCAVDSRIEIVGIADPNPESLDYATQTLNLPDSARRSFEGILQDPSVEWLFIGSPNRFHPEQIIAGFRAGKHVFCEKPLATTMEVIPDVVQAWKESGRMFAFGLVLRYAPVYSQCRQLLQSGRLGRIVSLEFNETLRPGHGGYIHGNWRRKRELAGTHLLEKCCHDLDICLWLTESHPRRIASFGGTNFFIPENREFGASLQDPEKGVSIYETWSDPQRVNPFGEDKDIVDNQVVIMEFANSIRATFHTNCNSAITERRFYIVGTKGALRADALTGVVEFQSVEPGSQVERYDVSEKGGHAGGDRYMAEQMVRTLLDGEPPAAGMPEAVRCLVAACGIDKALDSGTVYDLAQDWQRYTTGLG